MFTYFFSWTVHNRYMLWKEFTVKCERMWIKYFKFKKKKCIFTFELLIRCDFFFDMKLKILFGECQYYCAFYCVLHSIFKGYFKKNCVLEIFKIVCRNALVSNFALVKYCAFYFFVSFCIIVFLFHILVIFSLCGDTKLNAIRI